MKINKPLGLSRYAPTTALAGILADNLLFVLLAECLPCCDFCEGQYDP